MELKSLATFSVCSEVSDAAVIADAREIAKLMCGVLEVADAAEIVESTAMLFDKATDGVADAAVKVAVMARATTTSGDDADAPAVIVEMSVIRLSITTELAVEDTAVIVEAIKISVTIVELDVLDDVEIVESKRRKIAKIELLGVELVAVEVALKR